MPGYTLDSFQVSVSFKEKRKPYKITLLSVRPSVCLSRSFISGMLCFACLISSIDTQKINFYGKSCYPYNSLTYYLLMLETKKQCISISDKQQYNRIKIISKKLSQVQFSHANGSNRSFETNKYNVKFLILKVYVLTNYN